MSSVFSAIIRNVRTICVICAKYKKTNKKTDLHHLRYLLKYQSAKNLSNLRDQRAI